MGVMALAIISWFRAEVTMAIALGAMGAILSGVGIWGRLKSFLAAGEELGL
jgi:hypothetical protein